MRCTALTRTRLSALVLGAALVAGCSSGGDAEEPAGPAPDALVKAAAARSSGAGSSKVSVLTTTASGSRSVVSSGEGAYDYAKRTGTLTFSVPGADGQAATGGTIEERIVGDDLYLSLPQPKGVFYKLKVADVAGTSLGGSTDPTAPLQALKAATEVTEAGTEQVRGVETTHYEGAYDVQQALAATQGPARTILQTALRGASLETVPFDAYLDSEGRLVKLVQVIELPAGPTTGGQPLRSETSLELYEFGTTVTVAVPPAASVRDGAPLLAALRQDSAPASTAPSPATAPSAATSATGAPAPTATP